MDVISSRFLINFTSILKSEEKEKRVAPDSCKTIKPLHDKTGLTLIHGYILTKSAWTPKTNKHCCLKDMKSMQEIFLGQDLHMLLRNFLGPTWTPHT